MGYNNGAGFNFSNRNGKFVVETPEGKFIGTNSGIVLELERGTFKLSFDVFSCSFSVDEINFIGEFGCSLPDYVSEEFIAGVFDKIIQLLP